MTVGFTYVLVEQGSSEFLKVGKRKAPGREQLIPEARKRLGNLQSCNVRALRFAHLFEFASYEAAGAAEKAWHQAWRARAGLGAYRAQEWYRWSGLAGRSVSPKMVDAFMRARPGFVEARAEVASLSAAGTYLGFADATTKSGWLRQMRLHVLRLVDREQHFWHLYGTSAPNELARSHDIPSWWTGNPRRVTQPAVLERDSFDPAASQAGLGRASGLLRARFSRSFAPEALPSRDWPFALSWFEGDEASVIGAALEALGPAWRRLDAPVLWPGPVSHPLH